MKNLDFKKPNSFTSRYDKLLPSSTMLCLPLVICDTLNKTLLIIDRHKNDTSAYIRLCKRGGKPEGLVTRSYLSVPLLICLVREIRTYRAHSVPKVWLNGKIHLGTHYGTSDRGNQISRLVGTARVFISSQTTAFYLSNKYLEFFLNCLVTGTF